MKQSEIRELTAVRGFSSLEGGEEDAEAAEGVRPMTREELRAALSRFVVKRREAADGE